MISLNKNNASIYDKIYSKVNSIVYDKIDHNVYMYVNNILGISGSTEIEAIKRSLKYTSLKKLI
jgi:hypothetical protein